MKIVWIDPGGTAGWTVYERTMTNYYGDITAHENWSCGHLEPENEPHHLELLRFLESHIGKNTVFGCESYQIAPMPTADHYLAIEDIGVVKLFAAMHREHIVWQGAQFQDPKVWTPAKMKKLGVYKPGDAYKHAMSATRHVLHYLVHVQYRNDLLMRLR